MFGDPTDTPGGFAMKFHASIRIRLYKNGEIKDKSGNVIGAGVKAKIIKNKIAPQGRQCEFNLYFSRGIDDDESNFNFLVKTEFIRKPTTQSYELDFNGATHKFKTTQWRESVESIPGLKDFLKQKVKEKGILDLSYDAIQIDESTGTAKIANSNETD